MKRFLHSTICHILVIVLLSFMMSADNHCCSAQNEMYTAGEQEVIMADSVPGAVKLAAALDSMPLPRALTLYDKPYSFTGRTHDWNRLWINTTVLAGAFVGTLLVLECLPEDATAWNRAELQDVPLGERWKNHVIKEGPEWDHDLFIFNYVLHPYAGAVYYMSARSCGFNAWQSLLYCTCVSTIGWEFGIEAFMERPSYQDLFVTPIIGSAIGECFYLLKRRIVEDGYKLWGSSLLGNIAAFFIDPVNEVVGLFAGNPCRQAVKERRKKGGNSLNSSLMVPTSRGMSLGLSVSYSF